jgi:uncharacterized DUF497 family protein
MTSKRRRLRFRWIEWNLDHLATHGVDADEAESVVRDARRPYPLARGNDKYLVWGRGRGNRLLQVVFIIDDDGRIFVIHARPLTTREKKRLPPGV